MKTETNRSQKPNHKGETTIEEIENMQTYLGSLQINTASNNMCVSPTYSGKTSK